VSAAALIGFFTTEAYDGTAYRPATHFIGESLASWTTASRPSGMAWQATTAGNTDPETMARLSNHGFYTLRADETASGPRTGCEKARGSVGAPLYPQNGDALGLLFTGGWSEAEGAWKQTGTMYGSAITSWTSATYGTQLLFSVVPSDQTLQANSLLLHPERVVAYANGAAAATIDPAHLVLAGELVQSTSSTPTGTSAGSTGQLKWDADYLYVCASTNSWRRAALSGF
jgi:hypothetical protein